MFLVLPMPLRKSARGFVFIYTSPLEEMRFLLKTSAELEHLDGNSEDIQCQNMLIRYAKRSKNYKYMCLADFCSMYEVADKQYML